VATGGPGCSVGRGVSTWPGDGDIGTSEEPGTAEGSRLGGVPEVPAGGPDAGRPPVAHPATAIASTARAARHRATGWVRRLARVGLVAMVDMDGLLC
jgi:hypothetical protein